MPSYLHDAGLNIVSRATPRNTAGVSNPSADVQVYALGTPYAPLSLGSPEGSITPANLLANFFAREAATETSADSEISTPNYVALAAQGGSFSSAPQFFHRFPQATGATALGQRILATYADSEYVYMLWAAQDSFVGDYKIVLTRYDKFAEAVSSVVVSRNPAAYVTDFGYPYMTGHNQIGALYVDEAGGNIYIGLICDTNSVPAYGAGTGIGVMVLVYDRVTFTPHGVTPVIDMNVPAAGYTLYDLHLGPDPASNDLWVHCVMETTATLVHSILSGKVDRAALGSPTLLTSIVSKAAGQRLGRPQWVRHAGEARVLYAFFNNGANTSAIYTITTAGASDALFASQGVDPNYAHPPLFVAFGSETASFFTIAFLSGDGAGTTTELSVFTNDSALSVPSTPKRVGTLSSPDLGSLSGVTLQDGAAPSFFVIAKETSLEAAYLLRIEGAKQHASYPMSHHWLSRLRDPVESRAALAVYHADLQKVWAACDTTTAGVGEVFLAGAARPAWQVVFPCGDNWHRSMEQLRIYACGACKRLLDHQGSNVPGIRLVAWNDGTPAWEMGFENRSLARVPQTALTQFGAAVLEIHGDFLEVGPPDIAYAVIFSEEVGDLDNPVQLALDATGLYAGYDAPTILVTEPHTSPESPHTALAQATIEQFHADTDISILSLGAFSDTQVFYGLNASNELVLLDPDLGSGASAALLSPYDFVETIEGFAIGNRQHASCYCLVQHTDHPHTSLARLDLQNNILYHIGSMGDRFSDLMLTDDGILYGVTADTASNPNRCYVIDKDTAALGVFVTLSAGTHHRLAYDYESNILYHIYNDPFQVESFTFSPSLTPIALSGTTPAAGEYALSAVYYVSGVMFVVAAGSLKVFSVTSAGVCTTPVTADEALQGIAIRGVTLHPRRISGVGPAEIQALAQTFYSLSGEAMRVESVELLLQAFGTPTGIHRVLVLGCTSSNGRASEPIYGDVIAEGVLDLDLLSGTPALVEVPLAPVRPLLIGEQAAVVLSREEVVPGLWGIESTSGSAPYAMKQYSERSLLVQSEVAIDIPLETLETVHGFAIHPSTGVRYAIAKVAEYPDPFLATISEEGLIERVAFLTGYVLDDICFKADGTLFGATSTTSGSSPNSLVSINTGSGAITVHAAITAGNLHALGYIESQNKIYHLTTNAGAYESIDLGSFAVSAPIAQTGAPASLSPQSMVWHKRLERFSVNGFLQSYVLTDAGAWAQFEEDKTNGGNLVGVSWDETGITPVTTDFVNAVGWMQAADGLHYPSFRDEQGVWVRESMGFAMNLSGRIWPLLTIEASKDDGATWEQMDLTAFAQSRAFAWNASAYGKEAIGGRVTFRTSASGTENRLKLTMRGARHILHSFGLYVR